MKILNNQQGEIDGTVVLSSSELRYLIELIEDANICDWMLEHSRLEDQLRGMLEAMEARDGSRR